ncbi:putative membrane protein YkvI [Natranaerovirga pectinivora]|uniref:Putative membrane protein YkvI n=1 Tax=Natranaerovirga pectinivora TaxID=682400 RepID=A0A4R3MFL7_9FIRM|nr:hypothetical protein [Natranaerovirga pectinivora]TCT12308.1 putative membrane protein YkvI [Natranaerovirga pectinivora]
MDNLKNILKIAFVYIGTIIGAGFASGQEMLSFFTVYGFNGVYGLILTGFLFFVVGWAVLELVQGQNVETFKDFIRPITGDAIGTSLEWVIMAFMFTCFCAMLAGGGALLEQRFGWPYLVGVIVMAIACYITFLFDVKGVVLVNSILAPILLIGCLLLGLYIWIFRSSEAFYNLSVLLFDLRNNWFSSALIYVSYNTVTAIVILTTLHKYVINKKTAFFSALIAGVSLGMLGICLGIITLINYNSIQGVEIPMLTIVMQYAPLIQYIYILVIIAAMFTTAVANGYGIVAKLKAKEKDSNFGIFIFVMMGVLVAQIGFSTMVSKVYPVFGYIGLLELILILMYFIKYKTNQRKR